jgi:hypothetical protein
MAVYRTHPPHSPYSAITFCLTVMLIRISLLSVLGFRYEKPVYPARMLHVMTETSDRLAPRKLRPLGRGGFTLCILNVLRRLSYAQYERST